VFDIDEDFPLPQALGDLVSGDHLPMLCDQQDKKLEWLPFELEPSAPAAELKFAAIKTEVAELIDGNRH
jgi:hypothetical protein